MPILLTVIIVVDIIIYSSDNFRYAMQLYSCIISDIFINAITVLLIKVVRHFNYQRCLHNICIRQLYKP